MNILEQALTESIKYSVGEYKPTDKNRSYCLQNDGLYQIRETKLATYVFKESNGTYPGLTKQLKPGVTLKINKLPMYLFNQLWMFFRHINNLHSSEVYVSVYYDPENDEYKFLVPKQHVHGAIAEVNKDDGMKIIEYANKYIHVLETHSHNTMTGHFSTTDDKDQIDINALHLVIGNVDKEIPTYQLRYTLGKRKFDVKLDDLFESNNELDLSLFPNWKENINIKTYSGLSHYAVDKIRNEAPYRGSHYQNPVYGKGHPRHGAYVNHGGMVLMDDEVSMLEDDFHDDPWDVAETVRHEDRPLNLFNEAHSNAVDSDTAFENMKDKNGWVRL